MKNEIHLLVSAALIAGSLFLGQVSLAQTPENPFKQSAECLSEEGGVQGGGGDTATEGRIQVIRQDLVKWINHGGAKALDFSKSRTKITYDEYLNGNTVKNMFGMNDILVDGAVVINAIHTNEEQMEDEELNTYVDGFPKTCKGFISKKDLRPHMLCNIERFWDRKPGWTKEQLEAEQYRQIHHEYAALGKLEKNVGSDSDTTISDQVTSFLKPETVLRLAVGLPFMNPVKVQPGCNLYIGDLVDEMIGLRFLRSIHIKKIRRGLHETGKTINTYHMASKANADIIFTGEISGYVTPDGDYGASYWLMKAINGALVHKSGYSFGEQGFGMVPSKGRKAEVVESQFNVDLKARMSAAKNVQEYETLKAQLDPSRDELVPGKTLQELIVEQLPSCESLYSRNQK